MPHLERNGDIWLLNLGDGQNQLNPAWVAAVRRALDEVQYATGPRALVTCAGGRSWCTGLDLDWMGAHGDEADDLLHEVHQLLAQLLVLPLPTVAAVTGHAFAAGAMLACAHDQVVMRADRGYWCLPEVDLGLPFTPGMQALLRARLPVRAAHVAMSTGRRYGGHEALAAGLVDQAVAAADVVPAATSLAQPLTAKAGPALGRIKAGLYEEVLAALSVA